VITRTNSEWWFCRDKKSVTGYAPTSYLGEYAGSNDDGESSSDDGDSLDWQDDEYFGSYSHISARGACVFVTFF
jgi:hypothetical protein